MWKEELNRNETVEHCVAVVRLAVAVGGATAAAADAPAAALARVGDAHRAVAAAAALVACMVLAHQAGCEEVCQGNQWRAARAGVVEVRVLTLFGQEFGTSIPRGSAW